MNSPSARCVQMLCLAWSLAFCAKAEEGRGLEELICQRAAALLAPPDSPDFRKYAPDRKLDILHQALDVTPDFFKRTVVGQVTLTFKPIAQPLDELRLDAVDLKVSAVEATEPIARHQVTDREIVITFATPIPAGKETKVTVRYSAEPAKGLYFRTPEMGYKPGEAHLWTQGETDEARHWYPSFDYPNEKFTTEVTARVPTGMVVLSNGRRVSSSVDGASGLQVVRWVQDKPHANYLVSLLAGHFERIEDKLRDVPLEFWTLPSAIKEARNSFRTTKDTMEFFEREIGVPYPWAKYAQVCIADFHWGGMENTSITTLTDRTLFTSETESILNSEGLVAHEMAHQWFGDLVTCKDWSHIWLNEGFATYYAHLDNAHRNGRDAMLWGLYHDALNITRQTNETRGIVWRKYGDAQEMFNYLAYPKGSWILHMLRSQLGEELYRRCIKTYLERHQFGSVTTEDLNKVIEELSGRSFDQFFDQWVYHGQQPQLDVSYSWDEKAKLAKVNIKQTQKVSEEVALFKFPLTIRFKSKAGVTDHAATVKEKEEDFLCPLKEAPEIVRIDPELTVLAKVNFKPPTAMLHVQLADSSDMIGRLLAIEQLATKKDHESVEKLKTALSNDAFWGVRIKAAEALRSIHTDEALDALLASMSQTESRARNAVVEAIGGFYHPKAYEAAQKTLATEKNPVIQAAAIRAVGAYANPDVRETLLKFLNSDSYRQRLAEAAIAAMRAQDDAGYIAPLLDCLAKREQALTSDSFAAGLGALAFLTRNESKKDDVREFLTGRVRHMKERVRQAAIAALGTLQDPKAVAVLETFSSAAKDSPERQAAEKAITSIREAQKTSVDLKTLRNEVLDLQKSNRNLKKDLDELKKKVEAGESKPATDGKK